MSEDLVYHIVPLGAGGWQVRRDGDRHPTSNHVTRGQAVAKARALLAGDGEGRILIHRPDGTVREVRPRDEGPIEASG